MADTQETTTPATSRSSDLPPVQVRCEKLSTLDQFLLNLKAYGSPLLKEIDYIQSYCQSAHSTNANSGRS